MQANNSLTFKKGALRGLLYQLPPAAEVKVVRAISGALWDVIVDLRPGSPSYLKWYGAELTEDNRSMLYIPRGVRARIHHPNRQCRGLLSAQRFLLAGSGTRAALERPGGRN